MAKNRKAIFRIGTSNIVVPGNKETFPQEYRHGTRLQYYATLFNSLEINSSFYKVPMQRTFARWASEVPDDFQFTVKLWKGITHVKGLNFEMSDIDSFMLKADAMGNKKGCLLIQFPAGITIEHIDKVAVILEKIRNADRDASWRIAVEFRHPGWYNAIVYSLLDSYDASLVLHDMPKSKPDDVNKRAPFIFLRFHGEAGDYRGSYSPVFLKKKSTQIRNWLLEGRDVYAYFNNTIGDAFNNASKLKRLVDDK
jgi:uncharacterized protein YecE (DUF72 family)